MPAATVTTVPQRLADALGVTRNPMGGRAVIWTGRAQNRSPSVTIYRALGTVSLDPAVATPDPATDTPGAWEHPPGDVFELTLYSLDLPEQYVWTLAGEAVLVLEERSRG